MEVIGDAGAVLAGGHSSEGAELAFGLAVNGFVDPSKLLRGAVCGGRCTGPGTKPIGTGTSLQPDMRGARKDWIDNAVASMLLSNRAVADCLQRFGAKACTDVTGSGLLGHLLDGTRQPGRCAVGTSTTRRRSMALLPRSSQGFQAIAASGKFSAARCAHRGRRTAPSLCVVVRSADGGGLLAGIADRAATSSPRYVMKSVTPAQWWSVT